MSDDAPEDEPDRPTDEPGADRPADGPEDERRSNAESGADGSGWLSDLLTALDRLGELSADDRRRSGSSIVDYSVSVRSGLGDASGGRGRRGDRADRLPSGRRSSRGRRRDRSGSNGRRVTTRTREDVLRVTADVTGADPADVTVGFDGEGLVIGVDDELERVAVPWESPAADAVVRNGILTVTVEPDGDGGSADGGGPEGVDDGSERVDPDDGDRGGGGDG